MGTLFSALDIGRSGLLVSQVQLDVAAHNIANVNTEGFSRQRANIVTQTPNVTPEGSIGRGATVAGIERLRDRFLDRVFRSQAPGLGSAQTQATYFNRLEDIFQEPGEEGFGARIGVFFDALNDFANNVEGLPSRISVLTEAQALASSLNEAGNRLAELRTNANDEVGGIVPEINSLSERISDLNATIQATELTGRPANDLRDQRDLLIDQLANLVNITSNTREDGTVDVQLGGDELVTGRFFRSLETFVDPAIDPSRQDLVGVRFADNQREANVFDGELAGVIRMRDVEIKQVEDRMNTIARGIILNVNRVHSRGNGIENFSGPVQSTNAAADPAAPLNAADLPFPVQDGNFDVTIYDAAGNAVETRTITISASGPAASQTSLNDVASQLDASPFLSAAVDSDGFLTITPAAENTFAFSNDTSDALPALGINTLFTGSDMLTMGVNEAVVENPLLLSSGYSADAADTGDNRAALDMASLRNAKILSGDSQTISEFYESTIVRLGIDSRTNNSALEVDLAFIEDVNQRRLEISGVNLDEEVTSLVQFQRAFEASARVISVADQMLATLINATGA